MSIYFEIFISIPKPEGEGDRLKFKLQTDDYIMDEDLVEQIALHAIGMFRKEDEPKIEIIQHETPAEIPRKLEETLGIVVDGWVYGLDENGKLIKLRKLTKEDDEESKPH